VGRTGASIRAGRYDPRDLSLLTVVHAMSLNYIPTRKSSW